MVLVGRKNMAFAEKYEGRARSYENLLSYYFGGGRRGKVWHKGRVFEKQSKTVSFYNFTILVIYMYNQN